MKECCEGVGCRREGGGGQGQRVDVSRGKGLDAREEYDIFRDQKCAFLIVIVGCLMCTCVFVCVTVRTAGRARRRTEHGTVDEVVQIDMKRGQGGSGYITGGGRRELPPWPLKGQYGIIIASNRKEEDRWKGVGSMAGLPDRVSRAPLIALTTVIAA
jgi:hypothetical protein